MPGRPPHHSPHPPLQPPRPESSPKKDGIWARTKKFFERKSPSSAQDLRKGQPVPNPKPREHIGVQAQVAHARHVDRLQIPDADEAPREHIGVQAQVTHARHADRLQVPGTDEAAAAAALPQQAKSSSNDVDALSAQHLRQGQPVTQHSGVQAQVRLQLPGADEAAAAAADDDSKMTDQTVPVHGATVDDARKARKAERGLERAREIKEQEKARAAERARRARWVAFKGLRLHVPPIHVIVKRRGPAAPSPWVKYVFDPAWIASVAAPSVLRDEDVYDVSFDPALMTTDLATAGQGLVLVIATIKQASAVQLLYDMDAPRAATKSRRPKRPSAAAAHVRVADLNDAVVVEDKGALPKKTHIADAFIGIEMRFTPKEGEVVDAWLNTGFPWGVMFSPRTVSLRPLPDLSSAFRAYMAAKRALIPDSDKPLPETKQHLVKRA